MANLLGTSSIGVRQEFRRWLPYHRISIPVLYSCVQPRPRNLQPTRTPTLDKCGTNALIVSPEPSVLVEGPTGGGKGISETVLIIHDRSKRLHGCSVLAGWDGTREQDKHTIRSKTCRTIAAAPLNPPPRARLRAPDRSN